jgi:hypothetical protein
MTLERMLQMKLNDEIMRETFSKFDETSDPVLYYCYGTISATMVKMLLLGNLSAFANQYFLLGFSKTRLIMIKIDMLGKPQEPTIVPFSYFKNVQISDWLFGMGKKINIELTDNSKIRLKVNKTNVMLKKQKENLLLVCDMLSSRYSV